MPFQLAIARDGCLREVEGLSLVRLCARCVLSGRAQRARYAPPHFCGRFTRERDGYDLLGLLVGSEGLLGIVTEVTVRILRRPQTARALLIGFDRVESAGACVAAIMYWS